MHKSYRDPIGVLVELAKPTVDYLAVGVRV